MDIKLKHIIVGSSLFFSSIVVFAQSQCPASSFWVSSCNTIADTGHCSRYWQGSMLTGNTKTCKHATSMGIPYCTGGSSCYELYPDSKTATKSKPNKNVTKPSSVNESKETPVKNRVIDY